jgi:hypothetical protein
MLQKSRSVQWPVYRHEYLGTGVRFAVSAMPFHSLLLPAATHLTTDTTDALGEEAMSG